MKILHVTKKYDNLIGGDAVVVRNLREHQIMTRDDVYILTSNNSTIIKKPYIYKFGLKINDDELDTINIERIISLIILICYSFKILKKIKPDVIHTHSVDMGFAISFASRMYGIPQIITLHCGLFSRKNIVTSRSIIERIFITFSGFKKIITVNNRDIYQNSDKNILFIPNGVNRKIFKPIKRKNSEFITILYVGRIVELKGLDYLISAVNILNKKKYKVKLKIIGDGIYKYKLLENISLLKINNIQFQKNDTHEQLAKYYAQADLVVLPSIEQEGFGLVLIEALASGTPIITTRVSGLTNFIKQYDCGIVVPEKNSSCLANAIIKMIKDKNLRKNYIKNGQLLIKDKFSWIHIAKEINQIYVTSKL